MWNDADFEQAALEAAGDRAARASARATREPSVEDLTAIVSAVYQAGYYLGSLFEALVDSCAELGVDPSGLYDVAWRVGEVTGSDRAPEPGSPGWSRAVDRIVAEVRYER